MKLTTLILTIAILQVSAKAIAQKVTLNEKQASLDKVFKDIRLQTGYDFFIDAALVEKVGPVTIKVNNADLKDILSNIILSPLTYEINDKTVVVKLKKVSFLDHIIAALNHFDIHGHITDEQRGGIAGATVKIDGTTKYAITNLNGDFELKGVDQDAVVAVSFIGYETQKIKIKEADMGWIMLKPSVSVLDQVQVIGYGTNTKRFDVGSVATITAKEIENQPVSNVLLAMEGQVAGLNISQTNGTPGSAVTVQIRGQNTLLSDPNVAAKPYDQPLFIVDGVPFSPQNGAANLSASAGGVNFSGNTLTTLSPFNSINPNDIESITVLKDADATSIYGTQGSNGVILITTKKGKAGKTTLDFSINNGINFIARPVQTLNTQQYLNLRHQAINNDGVTLTTDPSTASQYPDLLVFDQNKNTNWYNTFFNNKTNNTDVHASLSGGTNNDTFILSGGYTRSTYDFPGDFADSRYTLHTSFHHISLNNRFTADFGTDYSYDQNNASSSANVATALLLPPNLPDLLDQSGNLIWNYKGIDISQYQLYGPLRSPSSFGSYNLNNTLRLNYKIITGLSVSVNAGYSRFSTEERLESPLADQAPSNPVSSAIFTNSTTQTLNIEPQINYAKPISNGILSVLLGSTYKKSVADNTTDIGYNYQSDALLGSITGAATTTSTDGSSIYRYSAVFGRIGYIYNQEYIINFTGRRDGSSNFGPGHQFGNFGSVGLGWIFTQEKVVKNALPVLSYGKISGSYGTSGSDGISPYQFQAFYQPNSSLPSIQGVRPYSAVNLYNPDYSWDLKKTLNLSVDLGFFKDRLLLNATYYRSTSGNQLINYSLPIQAGFNSVLENLDATVENKGWEYTLTSTNIKSKDFTWTTSFNISFNRNKLLAFPGLASSSYANRYAIGQSTSVVYGYRYKDVNPQTGLFEFYKTDGTVSSSPTYGTVASGGDEVPIADLQPKFFGGFNNTFTYKRFSLGLFFQFSKQTALNYLYSVYAQASPGNLYNEPVQVLGQFWQKPGDIASLQKPLAGYNNYTGVLAASEYFPASSAVYSDDFYIRLKNVALSYSFLPSLLKKWNISACRVYINAQNMLTITNYKVGDPETPGQLYAIPIQRMVVFGTSFNF